VSDLVIPAEEFAARREKAVEAARARGLNGLLIWSRGGTTVDYYGDVLYLANHHTPVPQIPDHAPAWSGRGYSVLVLPVDGEPVLLSDKPDYRDDLVQVDDVRVTLHPPVTAADVVREKGLCEGTLGLVGHESLLHSAYLAFDGAFNGSRPRLEPADDVLAAIRRVKSAREIELMRHAADVGSNWMARSIEAVEAGRTEGDCVGEGLRYAASNGA
jgi:Xaa-Pro aminopeptidase